MRVVVFTKDNYDYSSSVDEFVDEVNRRIGGEGVEKLDPEGVEGEGLARALDILEFPAVVALDDNESVSQQWVGIPLPPIDEVVYYVSQ